MGNLKIFIVVLCLNTSENSNWIYFEKCFPNQKKGKFLKRTTQIQPIKIMFIHRVVCLPLFINQLKKYKQLVEPHKFSFETKLKLNTLFELELLNRENSLII